MTAPTVTELDHLTLTVVVDNATDSLSSIASGVPQMSEMLFLLGREPSGSHDGHAMVSTLDHLCVACHGFSVLVTAEHQSRTATALFDVGPYGDVWLANAERLGVDLAMIDVVFLSHWHWDHSGALPVVLSAIAQARSRAGQPPVLVDVHPDRPDQRGIMTPLGVFAMLPPEPTLAELGQAGAEILQSSQVHLLLDGLLIGSGAIPRITAYEVGFPGHHSWRRGEVAEDPAISDERFLAAVVRGRGVTVLSACSHAGVVNVGLAAKGLLPTEALDLLLGGYHLAGAAVEDRIAATVRDLKDQVQPRVVAPGHCTGWRAAAALADAFGTALAPSVVGTRYLLSAQT